MEKQVLFFCSTCDHINKDMLGVEGFILRDTKYEFSEAFNHLLEYSDHYIYSYLKEDDEK